MDPLLSQEDVKKGLRDYQLHAIHKSKDNILIVIPCGGGKTVIGVGAVYQHFKTSTNRQTCICVCISQESCTHWASEFLAWTRLDKQCIVQINSKDDMKRFDNRTTTPCVIIATYNMLLTCLETADSVPCGIMIVDEAHHVGAENFQKIFKKTRSDRRVGLTATPVRIDGNIEIVLNLIGPIVSDISWKYLEERGFISNIECSYIVCPTTDTERDLLESMAESSDYTKASMIKNVISVMSPSKMQMLQELLTRHASDRVIVFIDNLEPLVFYARKFDGWIYDGKTKEDERSAVLQFYQSKDMGLMAPIFMSKVGDTGINIPDAKVVIEMSAQDRSQRQLTQRIGRVARPKPDPNQAYYYALINESEKENFDERTSYLKGENYTFAEKSWEISTTTSTSFAETTIKAQVQDMIDRIKAGAMDVV